MKQKSIIAAAIVLWPVSAFAWGQEGHSIVAEIAQRHLARDAPAVMSRIVSVLEPGTSLASIASWRIPTATKTPHLQLAFRRYSDRQ